MHDLEELLDQLGFKRYEIQCLSTLLKYKFLNAREAYKYSGVPQPKIYETMNDLKEKGLIDIDVSKKIKIYRIKPKYIIMNYIESEVKKINELGKESKNLIDNLYGSEESEEISFIGVAGMEKVLEFMYSEIDAAEKSIYMFYSPSHFNQKIITLLKKKKSQNVDVKLFFHKEEDISSLKNQLSKNIEIKKMRNSISKPLQMLFTMVEKFLTKEQSNSEIFDVIKKIGSDISEIFGILLIDEKKSLFRIPLPIETPMVILSTLPEIVEFHLEGIRKIMENSEVVH